MKTRRSRHGNTRGGTLLGVIFGVLVGVLISFGVVWYLNKTPLPFVEKVTKPEVKSAGNAAKPPVALPGKPGDKPLDKAGERKFEFYDILEGKKPGTPAAGSPSTPPAPPAVQPAPAPAPAPVAVPAPAKPEPAAAPAGQYLQVGAFQKPADAENLKARLAMIGFEANVLAVEVPNKGTMHRVRIGPYAGVDEMNRARSQLSEHGVPATVVRGKD